MMKVILTDHAVERCYRRKIDIGTVKKLLKEFKTPCPIDITMNFRVKQGLFYRICFIDDLDRGIRRVITAYRW